MSDATFFTELAETRRKLWSESDGTLDGYAALCSRIAQEAIAGDAAEQSRKQAKAGRTPPRRRRGQRAMVVCEGDAPEYGAGGKGAE